MANSDILNAVSQIKSILDGLSTTERTDAFPQANADNVGTSKRGSALPMLLDQLVTTQKNGEEDRLILILIVIIIIIVILERD